MPYTFTNIPSSYSIGNSLSSVNENYLNLDKWTTDISLSAQQLWEPLLSFYNANKTEWEQVVSLTQQYSAKWLNTTTIVENNSAKWTQPISIFYPEIFPNPFTSENLLSATNFLNTTFPVGDPKKVNKPNYIEGQTFIIYCYTYTLNQNVINSQTTLRDSTICSTNPRDVCLTCTNIYTGVAPCNGGNFYCSTGPNSCVRCASIGCRYTNPPYSGSGSSVSAAIQANVYTQYSERFENTNVTAIMFIVQNCEWRFLRFL